MKRFSFNIVRGFLTGITNLMTLAGVCLAVTVFGQETMYQEAASDMYRRGITLLDGKNLAQARDVFEQYAANYTDENQGNARYYTAYCALSLYHRDGEKLMEDFINDFPAHPKTGIAYYEMGVFYFKGNNYSKTVQFLEKANIASLTTEKREEALFMLGYASFSLKKFEEALEYFNKIKNKSGGSSSAAAYYAGFIEYDKGDYENALTDFQQAEKSEAYKSEVPYMIASVLYKKKEFDRLLKYTSRLLSSDENLSNKPTLFLLTAEALFSKKDYKNAVGYYEPYNEAMRNNMSPELIYRLGYSYYKIGEQEKALIFLRRAATEKGEMGIYASYFLGILYLEEDNKRYAATAFDVVRKNTFNAGLQEDGAYQYAKLQYDLGDSRQAILAMENFITTYPQSTHRREMIELLSEAYLTSNAYEKAIAYIEKLPSRSKNIELAYQKATFMFGTELYNHREYRRAVELFEKSLKYPLDMEYVMYASFWAAEAYSVGTRYEEAVPHYQKVLSLTSPDKSAYYYKSRYGLGYAYYNTKQYEKAMVSFREAITARKDFLTEKTLADTYVRLGDCYYIAKQYNEALSNYNKALAVRGSDREYIMLQTGIVNVLQENYSGAFTQFDNIIRIGNVSRFYDDALYQKGQLLFDQGKYKESMALYTKIITEIPASRYVPLSLMRRASANYNTSNFEGSITDYVFLLEKYATHEMAAEALIPLQDVLAMLDRSTEFEKYLAAYKQANPGQKGLEAVEYEASKNQYFNQQYQKAIDGLLVFITNYPEDPNVVEAKYYIGDSYYRLKNISQAEQWLEGILNEKSFWQYPKVVERLAEIGVDQKHYSKALRHYNALESMADTKRKQNEAWSGLIRCYYHLGEYEKAIEYCNMTLQSGSMDVNAENRANLFLGKSYYAMGNYDRAKDEFLNTTNTSKDENGAEAQYLLGEVFFFEKEYRNSIDVLIDLNKNFSMYTDWVGKGFLLIADNYVEMNDLFQAKGTLNSLIEHFPRQEIKEKAKARLSSLEKLEHGANRLDSIPGNEVQDTLK